MMKRSKKIENEAQHDNSVVYRKTVLESGLTILSEEVPAVESFALGVTANAGSRDDEESLSGLAHFVEHTAFRSTLKRSAKQIARQFEDLGAYSNAFTTKDVTCYYVRALSGKFSKILDILIDLAAHPVFVQKDVEKERSIIIEEIRSYEDDPEELIFDYGDKLIYNDAGPSLPIAGFVESVEKINSEHLIEFHKKYYDPRNIIISVAGNIPHDRIVREVSDLFDLASSGAVCHTKRTGIAYSPDNVTVEKPFQQAHILLCRQVEGMQSEDRYPLAVLNILLGDGFSSRLYQRLREKHGLAYSVYSSLQTMADVGGLYVYAGTDEKNTAKTERLIYSELEKLYADGITKTELNRAKEQIKSSTIMALESMSTRMQSLAKSEFCLGVYEDIERTNAEIDAITMDSVDRTIKKYFNRDSWCKVQFNPED